MTSNNREVTLSDVLDAIQDQSRIAIAFREDFENKSEAARRLTNLGIPPSRVAALLGTPLGHVTSAVAKGRRKTHVTSKSPASSLDGSVSNEPE